MDKQIKAEYQGWDNYQTWVVNLWIDNEQGSQETSNAIAIETRKEDVDEWRRDLADALKEWIEENMPDLGASMWSDLLRSAWSEINWYEIAETKIDSILENEKYEKEKKEKGE
jgi:hypothetical protein